MNKSNFRGYLAWIAVCILWGTTYLAIRIGVESLPPMLFAGIRWIIAGLIFITVLRLSGKNFPAKKDMFHLSVMGLSMLGVGNGLVVVGEQYINSGLAALLITTVPFWIVGMETFFSKEIKINSLSLTGLLIGLLGITLIFGNDWKDLFDSKYYLGVLSIMGAVVAWSYGSVYSKYKKVSVHPLMSASVQMLIAGFAQTVLGFILGEFSAVSINQSGLFSLGYLIIAGSILGYGSYIYAIEHLPLSLVSTYAYINPIIALFLGWLVLNEKLDVFIISGAIVIILGVLLVRQGSKRVPVALK